MEKTILVETARLFPNYKPTRLSYEEIRFYD